MTEVTGGTFWKEYTKGQIEGTEGFPLIGISKKEKCINGMTQSIQQTRVL